MLSLKFALQYLRPQKKEGFLSLITVFSVLGVTLGVATLIIVMSVMNGFRAELMNYILGLNGHVTVFSHSDKFPEYQDWQRAVGFVRGVQGVQAVLEGQAMIMSKKRSSGILVRGLSAKDFADMTSEREQLYRAENFDFDNPDTIVLGKKLAAKLGLMLDDTVTLVAPSANSTAFGLMPRLKRYTVGAIIEFGMHQYDSSLAFMPISSAQVFFKKKGSITHLQITTADVDNVDAYAHDIKKFMGAGFRVQTWKTLNGSFFDAIQTERDVMFIILTLIILVAAFNIVSSLVLMVTNKTSDIAILRTIGASKKFILQIFLGCGAVIGVVSCLFGFLLGIFLTYNLRNIKGWVESIIGKSLFSSDVYFLNNIPYLISWSQVFSVVVVALVISLIASVYPAYKASKVNPIEAIKFG
jgi:lipoprotein-releasing system permease protein